ncbi:UPF0223 family protein [Vagococcus sp. PNs007]|uniref:UPF0223 family protein n=1 Tax=Vagococcus proximus TaxID=2991417 RepID=A0ABT5X374_9ENTE|nr:UPF0223 family protein [Vagococcus proximus]MDF0480418.1 UPF0223 family protein [Vagococcus proximus]
MEESYSYPLDLDWSQSEMVVVMEMWQVLEDVYEKGVEKEAFLSVYKKFKTVVKSIGEERQLGKDFEAASGYSLYRTVQEAKKTPGTILKMKGA